MKLPTPGKLKLPGVGSKAEKTKTPKAGGSLADKLPKFQIKSGFLQKNLVTLIAAAVLLIGTGTAYGTLSSRDADRGYDPINGVNEGRYQVLVSGEGYKLSKQQEKNYKLQKKQNEVNAAQAVQAAQTPTTIRTSTGMRTFRTPHYTYRRSGSSGTFYNTSRLPRLYTNIYQQQRTKTVWKAGEDFTFKVAAYYYPYGSRNVIPAKDIKVRVTGGTLKHNGKDGSYQKYTLTLGKGQNSISIVAKDKKNKKQARTSYTIYAGSGQSYNNNNSSNNNNNSNNGNNSSNNGNNNSGNKGKKKQEDPKPTPTPTPTPTGKPVDVNFGFGSLKSGEITITDKTRAYDVLKATDGIKVNTNTEAVTSVTGTDMTSFSFDSCDPDVNDVLQEIYQNEQLAKDKESKKSAIDNKIKNDIKEDIEDEINERIREEVIEENPDLDTDSDEFKELLKEKTDEEFDEYLDEYFDTYRDEHEDEYNARVDEYFNNDYYDNCFNKWAANEEKTIQKKAEDNDNTIKTGQKFHKNYKFVWIYNEKAKGKDVVKNINLRLTLVPVE